jgi:Mg-chelatase subunit ChlD
MNLRLAAVALAVVGLLPAQAAPPSVRIIAPTSDSMLIGPSDFVAEIIPGSLAVRDVVFQVDGVQVCKIERAPYRCQWDAGDRTNARSVRVVATPVEGVRFAAAVRTKGLHMAQSSGVDSVVVTAHVTDDRDKFVDGLPLGAFRVLEDGVEQKVTSMLSEDAPINLLMALDVSGSMAPAVGELRAAASSFLQALRPKDRVTLAGFNNGLFVLAPATADSPARLAALEGLLPSGGTALYDSMIRGVELIRSQSTPRAMVVFSDGDDVSSLGTLETARMAIQGADAVLYFIAQGKADRDPALRASYQQLARETGGDAYLSTRMSAVREHFAEIVEELAHQYVLVYTPKRDLGDGAWRKIAVQVQDKDRKYNVRARQGYFALKRGG